MYLNVIARISVILAQCRYTETAQRMFKYSDRQYTSLDKKLNSLTYTVERYAISTYRPTGVTNFKISPVFGSPCTLQTSENDE